jgi:hypothetical protein
VVEGLLKGKKWIGLSEWLEGAFDYFNFNEFRRLFNIFKEEKL